MATIVPQERELAPISRIQRIAGKPDDPYEVIFLNRESRIIVPLTEWYRLRKSQGPLSTRETYLLLSRLHARQYINNVNDEAIFPCPRNI